MSANPQYDYALQPQVKQELDNAPPRDQAAFYELLELIREEPQLGSPLKDDLPNTYTASFDSDVMLYEVLERLRLVWVLRIYWLGPFMPGPGNALDTPAQSPGRA